MPYDTRRKSLSLPSLGIQLPNGSRAHRSGSSEHKSKHAPVATPSPPAKRIKRSHSVESSLSPPPQESARSPAASAKSVTFAEQQRPKSSGWNAYEDTPPPSPRSRTSFFDSDAIHDDIVVGVIEQLQKTGNRPHLLRDLATVLSTVNPAVSSSANPGALICSRLTNYLKRSCWNASTPCPLGKELSDLHPRKVYYSLTTMPRQDLPLESIEASNEPASLLHHSKIGKRIISPSISSASVDGETAEERKRQALSPSPEIDLSAHEVAEDVSDLVHTKSMSIEPSPGTTEEQAVDVSKGDSPPLELDEKEFTQTASNVRLRGMSLDLGIRQLDNEDRTDDVMEESLFAGSLGRAPQAHLFSSSPQLQPISSVVGTASAMDLDNIKSATPLPEDPKTIVPVMGVSDFDWTTYAEDVRTEDLDDLFNAMV